VTLRIRKKKDISKEGIISLKIRKIRYNLWEHYKCILVYALGTHYFILFYVLLLKKIGSNFKLIIYFLYSTMLSTNLC